MVATIPREAYTQLAADVPGAILTRIIPFAELFSTGASHLMARGEEASPDIGQIDPDSSGVSLGVLKDGLDNLNASAIHALFARTTEREIDYSGQMIDAAKGNAEDFVEKQLLNLQLAIDTSTDGRVAYYIVRNTSVFDHRITTVAVDGGTGDGVVACPFRNPLVGGVVVGSDVLESKDVYTTVPLSSVEIGFDPSRTGRVCPDCANAVCLQGMCSGISIDEGQGMNPLAPAAPNPDIPAARRITPPDACTGGTSYAFGTESPTDKAMSGVPLGSTDGFTLRSGSSIVLASETTLNRTFSFGVAGFRLDEQGNVLKGLYPQPADEVSIGGHRVKLSFSKAELQIPPGAVALAVQDVSGDGRADVILADDASGDVTVLRQEEDGTFANRQIVPVGRAFPIGLVIGDVDGDSLLDIVTANAAGVVTLIRQTERGFVNHSSLRVAPFPTAIALGDIDGQGGLDIVTINEPGTLSVLINRGSGTFPSIASRCAADSQPAALTIANVTTANAGAEVVTVDDDTGNISVFVYTGQGCGLTLLMQHSGVEFPSAISAGDLDRNQTIDIVAISEARHSAVVLLNPDGNGDFESPVSYPIQPRDCQPPGICLGALFPVALDLGDIDRDGNPDVITAEEGGVVTVLLNRGDGHLDPPRSIGRVTFPLAIGASDLDGDGFTDLLVAADRASTATLLRQVVAGKE